MLSKIFEMLHGGKISKELYDVFLRNSFKILLACDRGYGKKKVIEILAKRNFKVITIANAMGSEHALISFSVVDAYREKIHLCNVTNAGRNNESSEDYIDGVLESNLEEFDLGGAEFMLSNKETLLLGPEIKVCQHASIPSLFASVFHDIYRKEVVQKIYGSLFMGFHELKNYSGI
jgi:hypothetical protein